MGSRSLPNNQSLNSLFLHEFSHTIFNSHLKVRVGERAWSIADIISRFREIEVDPWYVQMRAERIRLVELAEAQFKRSDYGRVTEARVEVLAVNDQIRLLDHEIDRRFELSVLANVVSEIESGIFRAIPENEFFADLGAALYSNNMSVIADGFGRDMSHMYRQANPHGPRPRAFESTTNFNRWRPEENGADSYTRFDPIRGALIKLLRKHGVQPAQYPKVLEAVMDAIQLHRDQIESLPIQTVISHPDLNRQLFGFIVGSLRSHGLLRGEP